MKLTMQDLETQCNKCRGEGYVMVRNEEAWEAAFDRYDAKLPSMDMASAKADSEVPWERQKCDKCYGSGIMITETGQVVLEFVGKHLKTS